MQKKLPGGGWKRRRLGMVHVYTGDGKGKTTAALGLGLRASGHGLRVLMIQFMKGHLQYGEQKAARKMKNFQIVQFGRKEFVSKANPAKVDLEYARKGMEFCREAVSCGDYDVVIIDELNCALEWNLVRLDDVLSLIRGKSPGTELVITGRYAHPQVMEMADYVTEMREIAHPYTRRILSVKGVEH